MSFKEAFVNHLNITDIPTYFRLVRDIFQLRQSLLLEAVENVFAGLLDGQFGVDDTD
jgi:hypothetical protein